eukprot:superscaffoldBa00004321_g18666
MDLKVVFVIVCLCALAITTTDAGIPKCCVKRRRIVPIRFLEKVERTEVQKSNGACDISALILYVEGMAKPICAHPKVERHLTWIQRQRTQNKRRATY